MRCEGVVHHTQRQPRAPKRRRETFVPFLLGGVLCKQNSWTGNPGVKSQLLVVPPRTTTKLARRSSSSAARRVEISRLLASARAPHARGTRPVPSGRAPRLDRSPGRARLAAPPRLPSGRVVRATRCRSPPPLFSYFSLQLIKISLVPLCFSFLPPGMHSPPRYDLGA